MSDAISRHGVSAWLANMGYRGLANKVMDEDRFPPVQPKSYREGYQAGFKDAQPERIKGHWIEITLSNHTYKCSVCGRLLVNITDGKNNVAKNYPYCHCGADMRGEQDE